MNENKFFLHPSPNLFTEVYTFDRIVLRDARPEPPNSIDLFRNLTNVEPGRFYTRKKNDAVPSNTAGKNKNPYIYKIWRDINGIENGLNSVRYSSTLKSFPYR